MEAVGLFLICLYGLFVAPMVLMLLFVVADYTRKIGVLKVLKWAIFGAWLLMLEVVKDIRKDNNNGSTS